MKIDFSSLLRNSPGDGKKIVDKFFGFLSFFSLSPSSGGIRKVSKRNVEEEKLKVVGFRIERTAKEPEIDDDGIPILRADTTVTLRLFGSGFTDTTRIGLTSEKSDFGKRCNKMSEDVGYAVVVLESSTNALVELRMPKESHDLYLCASLTEEVR
jgi:hypothetical protein